MNVNPVRITKLDITNLEGGSFVKYARKRREENAPQQRDIKSLQEWTVQFLRPLIKHYSYTNTMVNAIISTLVGAELHVDGWREYSGTLAASNGSIYGIPCLARRVVKFNPVDNSITHIGPDLGDKDCKWIGGAITGSGIIYCVPCSSERGILKIDTNTDNVTELDRNLFPEQGYYMFMWKSCAAALDGCIYFMPSNACRIMKLDPNNNDAVSSVGDDLGDGSYKYSGTVVGMDGCVYGIPDLSERIIKYDPFNGTTSFVGKKVGQVYKCKGRGALGRDGCIYALTGNSQVLKIDTANNSFCFIGNSESYYKYGDWNDAILGIDGCIYWPPYKARRILKYDPHTNKKSLVGNTLETRHTGNTEYKWFGGCLASDGVIYCFPCVADWILSIDPWKEYTSSLKHNMIQYPEQLQWIFLPSDDMPTETNFDRSVTKFGYEKALEVLEHCIPPADEVCAISDLYPFMIAASYRKSDLSVIYRLLRHAPSKCPLL